MPRIENLQKIYRVDIIESERGWGSKVDESIYFDNQEEAVKYANDYNDKYNPPLKPGEGVPDWYMYADYVGKIS
jgi:hypothetical protein